MINSNDANVRIDRDGSGCSDGDKKRYCAPSFAVFGTIAEVTCSGSNGGPEGGKSNPTKKHA